jgi:hypothetical protein
MSLAYIAQAAEHRRIEFDGNMLRVLLGADITDGQVSVMRARVPAGFTSIPGRTRCTCFSKAAASFGPATRGTSSRRAASCSCPARYPTAERGTARVHTGRTRAVL